MLLYLVRHGETALGSSGSVLTADVHRNAQGVYQGRLPEPLNGTGCQQAELLAEQLRGVPFKQCWSSHLPRAAETAKIVLGPYHPKTSIQLDPLLADRDMGALEGKAWVANPEDVAGADIESDEALAQRLHTFLTHLIQTHTPLSSPLTSPRTPATPSDQGAGCVLVVTHEACILALLQLLTESSAKDFFPTKPDAIAGEPTDVAEDDMRSDIALAPGSPLTPTSRPLRKTSNLPCIVDAHIPADVDVGLQCANTALCVVRVWWEEATGSKDQGYMDQGLEAKGRIEMWGDIAHLDEF